METKSASFKARNVCICLVMAQKFSDPALMLSLLVITAAHGMHMPGMSAHRVAQPRALKKATINQAKVHVIYCGK